MEERRCQNLPFQRGNLGPERERKVPMVASFPSAASGKILGIRLGRGGGRGSVRIIFPIQDQKSNGLPHPEPSLSGQTWALQVWTSPKDRAGREEESERFLSHIAWAATALRPALKSCTGYPHLTLGATTEFSPPSVTGCATCPLLYCRPVAGPFVTSMCKVPLLRSPIGVPGAKATDRPGSRIAVAFSPMGSEGWFPHPGGGMQTESGSQSRAEAEAGLSAQQTRLSRSHTLSPRSAGRAVTATLSSPLSSSRPGPRGCCFPSPPTS